MSGYFRLLDTPSLSGSLLVVSAGVALIRLIKIYSADLVRLPATLTGSYAEHQFP